jgi:hypothetical protein
MSLTEQQRISQDLTKCLNNRWLRLNSLYFIKNKQGKKIPFRMNWAQVNFYKALHYFNVILKARQLGFTTFILIYFLDCCLFNDNQSAGVIAHTREDAEDLFDNKVKFAYDNLPEDVKVWRPANTDTAKKLVFNNGSSFNVGTSLRSGTYQKLLISEFGKISAKFPAKAMEIKTGALNTVEAGQQIFIESTAEGKTGEFFDLVALARNLKAQDKTLTNLEPRFHFYAWFDNPEYKLNDEDTANTTIPQEISTYLSAFTLTPNQKAWYAAKANIMGDEMRREYPSTPDEAFEGSIEGAFYAEEMLRLRQSGGIGRVPYDASRPVMTFWDLGGARDQFSIWFYQYVNKEHRFIDYHESNGQGWAFYANLLNAKGYAYSKHYMPHDANTRRVGININTGVELAQQVGIKPIEVIPVTKSVYDDIRNYCKPFLPQCRFDESKCALGLQRLDSYRKKWDDINGMWLNEAQHDSASHGADGFRTAAVALKDGNLNTAKPAPLFRYSTQSRSENSWMAG